MEYSRFCCYTYVSKCQIPENGVNRCWTLRYKNYYWVFILDHTLGFETWVLNLLEFSINGQFNLFFYSIRKKNWNIYLNLSVFWFRPSNDEWKHATTLKRQIRIRNYNFKPHFNTTGSEQGNFPSPVAVNITDLDALEKWKTRSEYFHPSLIISFLLPG